MSRGINSAIALIILLFLHSPCMGEIFEFHVESSLFDPPATTIFMDYQFVSLDLTMGVPQTAVFTIASFDPGPNNTGGPQVGTNRIGSVMVNGGSVIFPLENEPSQDFYYERSIGANYFFCELGYTNNNPEQGNYFVLDVGPSGLGIVDEGYLFVEMLPAGPYFGPVGGPISGDPILGPVEAEFTWSVEPVSVTQGTWSHIKAMYR